MKHIITIEDYIGWDTTTASVRAQILAAGDEEIEVQINSGGGFITDGLAIFNLIKLIPQRTTARIIGLAGSMASIIPLATDYVIAEASSVYFIHNALAYMHGNQHEHREIAGTLEALSTMLARVLSLKSGRPIEEIQLLLDAESYFIGSEMLDAGFVDEIAGEPAASREEAVALATLKIEDCNERRKNAQPEDYNKIAAYIKPEKILNPSNTRSKPQSKSSESSSNATQKSKTSNESNEMDQLTLEEFLAKYPAEKVKYDNAILQAGKDGAASIQTTVDKVTPFFASDKYGKNPAVIALGIKVLEGKSNFAALEGAITTFDMIEAARISTAASEDSAEVGDLSTGGPGGEADGVAKNAEEMKGIVAEMKGRNNPPAPAKKD